MSLRFQNRAEVRIEEVDSCTEYIVAVIEIGRNLRVPRNEDERRNEFSEWLALQRTRLEPLIREELQRHLKLAQDQPDISSAAMSAAIERTWSTVREMLIQYALLGLASAWTSRHLGDALLLGSPEPMGQQWRIPLRLNEHGLPLGQIVLDRDGNIDVELTTSRSALLEAIRAQTRPPASATTG